jgi:hypothetical protein
LTVLSGIGLRFNLLLVAADPQKLDGDGRPVCSEMWPGNTADVTTLIPVISGNWLAWEQPEGLIGPNEIDASSAV